MLVVLKGSKLFTKGCFLKCKEILSFQLGQCFLPEGAVEKRLKTQEKTENSFNFSEKVLSIYEKWWGIKKSKPCPTDLSIPEAQETSHRQVSDGFQINSATWVFSRDWECSDRSRPKNSRSRTRKLRIPNLRTASLGVLGCCFCSCLCAGKINS